jgi:hypothetical protein
MRYPSYPLVTHDPYFSIWSATDNLNESWPKHWTGTNHELCGIIRIDEKPYAYLGAPGGIDKMTQTSVNVTPTRTIYTFKQDGVKLTLTFLTPALPQKLDILSRSLTYVVYDLEAMDNQPHDVQIYLDLAGELCVNDAQDEVSPAGFAIESMGLLSFTPAQPKMLQKVGDNLRIEWGRVYLGFPHKFSPDATIAPRAELRSTFKDSGLLPQNDFLEPTCTIRHPKLAAATAFDLLVEPGSSESAHLIVAYDDIHSLEFLRQRLDAYWRKDGKTFAEMLNDAEDQFQQLRDECVAFDDKLLADCAAAGGDDYADLCAIAYRQAIAAHKLVAAADGTPLFFSKENFSNGCICTVDITYPSAPLFLLTQPKLLKGMMIPILEYASLDRWKFNFAPHDLGTYPLANGQVYGGGEKSEVNQMPVEESGNMLILAGALLEFEKDIDFVAKYWNLLKTWADYLLEKGYDPENQLCTDDFAGHLAHNTNLSIKAIMAMAAFSKIAKALGKQDIADQFMNAAKNAAEKWQVDALDDHGAYRLAFDRPGTWSQKYNLVWDKLLNLNLFPAEVKEREVKLYLQKLNEFGLPLDSRKTYTKLDWIIWSASLAKNDEDFQAILAPTIKFLQETPDRVPLTDWYETTNAKKVGFQARAVVGGLFIKLLYNPNTRKNYR